MHQALLLTLLLTNAAAIQSREAYVTRDGLRIYHLVMLERGHRRFQHEVLSFLDRP